MQIFASDLFGSTTKIAFLKISPNPTGWKIIYGTFDTTLRPTCLADTSATEQTVKSTVGRANVFQYRDICT